MHRNQPGNAAGFAMGKFHPALHQNFGGFQRLRLFLRRTRILRQINTRKPLYLRGQLPILIAQKFQIATPPK